MRGEPISEHRARMALENAFGQLDQGWLILVDLRLNGPADATDADYVILHPDYGIALIDVILSRTGDPPRRLREFLEGEGFFAQFPGTLPVVRLVLKPTDTISFRRRLDAAFAEAAPIAITDPNWVAALNGLLVPAALSAPQPIVPSFAPSKWRPASTPHVLVQEGESDAVWNVAPARWPDQVAEATPLKRQRRSTQFHPSPLTEVPNFTLASGSPSQRPPLHRQASQRGLTEGRRRDRQLQARAKSPRHMVPQHAVLSQAPPQRATAERMTESFGGTPENETWAETPPQDVAGQPEDLPPHEGVTEHRPPLPSAIAPTIQQAAQAPIRAAGENRPKAGLSLRIMREAAVDGGVRMARGAIVLALLAGESGRWRVRAVAAALLVGILGGAAVWLAFPEVPGYAPGRQAAAPTTGATSRANPAPNAVTEASAAGGMSAQSSKPIPLESTSSEPIAAPELSAAALAVPARIAGPSTALAPPVPRAKPIPPPATDASPIALSATPTPGIEKVRIATGIHDGFGRVVFAWPKAVNYETHLDGQSLTIRFSRPFATDLARIAKQLPLYVESATMDGESTVVIALKRPFGVDTMLNRNRVAIDLLDQSAAAAPSSASPPEPAPASSQPPPVAATLVEEGGVRRLIFAWPEAVDFTADVAKGEARIRFKRAATIDPDQLAAAVPDLAPRVSAGKSEVSVFLTLPAGSRLKAYHKGKLVIVDVAPARRPKPGASSRPARSAIAGRGPPLT